MQRLEWFIPARAGQPSVADPARSVTRVHPRASGAARPAADGVRRDRGSSPRGRGSPQSERRRTPGSRVHPRAGGAAFEMQFFPCLRGLSPCARGSRFSFLHPQQRAGFIPARAGRRFGATAAQMLPWVHPRSRHVMAIVTSAGDWITLRIPAAHSRALACRICVFRSPAPVHVSNAWFASASVLLGLGISRRSCSHSSSCACLFRLDTHAWAAIPIVATVPAASTALIAHDAVCVSIGLLRPLLRLGVRLVSFGVGRVHPRACGGTWFLLSGSTSRVA